MSQIAVTNISSTAGLSLKYNNQMVRNSKAAIACYEDTKSINRLTCENTFSVIVHISS